MTADVPLRARDYWTRDGSAMSLLARNITSEYLALGVNVVIGIVMLPFNLSHLGESAYGLWMLTVSITTYFSILELGYGSSQVKFAAEYRAKRDARALNEVASTLFFIFVALGTIAYAAAVVLSVNLTRLFDLDPAQETTGRLVLLIVSAHVAFGFPFSVFGGLVNGFQRYYLNNAVSLVTSVATAAANVAVLLLGYGLVHLVAVTTVIRILSFVAYYFTARATFPDLSIRWRHVHMARVREITGFSATLFVVDIATKINMSSDTVVIGAVMGTAAIAGWAVATRFSGAIWTLTRVLSRFLFPNIVESATRGDTAQLRALYVEGTRASLAFVIPLAVITAVLAEPLLAIWVGPRFAESAPLIWVLGTITTIRIGEGVGHAVLKGAGHHRLLARASIGIALLNLALSIALVRPLGLLGVAIGTLIPVAAISSFFLFPAACRRVDIRVAEMLHRAVWPAAWPAIPAAGLGIVLRESAGLNLVMVLGVAAVSIVVYLAVFARWGLDATQRRWYAARLASLRRPRERPAMV